MGLTGSYDEVSQSFTRKLKFLLIAPPAFLIFLIILFTITGCAIGLSENQIILINVVLGLTIVAVIAVKLHGPIDEMRNEDKKIGETEKQIVLSHIKDPTQGVEVFIKKQLLILKIFLLIAAIILFGMGMFVLGIIFLENKPVTDKTSGIILAIIPILLSLVLIWITHSKILENKIINKMKKRIEQYEAILKTNNKQ